MDTPRVAVRRADDDPGLVAAVRQLFLEYQQSLGIDLCFQNFAAELDSLPGAYARPRGCLLLATVDGRPIGCVAVRELDERTAELKRLYVRDAARGHGVGRTLVQRALVHARRRGYERVLLDTLPSMHAAQRLYRSFGFRETRPYTDNPVSGAQFMQLDLGAPVAR